MPYPTFLRKLATGTDRACVNFKLSVRFQMLTMGAVDLLMGVFYTRDGLAQLVVAAGLGVLQA